MDNCESLPVSGWNSSDFLVDPYTYDYWTVSFVKTSLRARPLICILAACLLSRQ